MKLLSAKDNITKEFQEHQQILDMVISALQDDIWKAYGLIIEALQDGKKLLLFGNGGSAADAQHIAAELTGRFKRERRALRAIALTTDTSVLTAIGNDYSYENIFDRQIEALADPGDIMIGISTSGNSKNVLKALEKGNSIGCRSIGLSGMGGGLMNDLCHLNIVIPSADTARIQEMHILIGHIICQLVDDCELIK